MQILLAKISLKKISIFESNDDHNQRKKHLDFFIWFIEYWMINMKSIWKNKI